ncbi:MAG: YdcF family protein [Candidatus Poribacteria bacterium]|nr:YdcF family protein [Candidatus Poribacteria bacterium]
MHSKNEKASVLHPAHYLASLLRCIHRRFFWLFCGGMLLAVLLFVLWLWRGAHYLIVETEIAPSDVIIVLGGGTERVREGTNLYHRQYAPHLLFTGGGIQFRLAHVYLDWGRILRYAARIEGVPPKAMLVDMGSTSTYEDAVNTRRMLEARGWTSAIVVSSIYHMRRARMIFEKVYDGSGIRLHYRPAPSDRFHPDGWWKYERDMIYVVEEYIKLVLYRVKYF